MNEQEEIGVSTQQQHHCYHPLLYIQNTGKESLYLSKAVTMATKSQNSQEWSISLSWAALDHQMRLARDCYNILFFLWTKYYKLCLLVLVLSTQFSGFCILKDAFLPERSRIFSCLKMRHSLPSHDLSYHQAPVLSVCCHS